MVWAKLTPEGLEKLREASRTHVAGIESLFVGRFSDEELATLSSLLSRLPGAAVVDDDCEAS